MHAVFACKSTGLEAENLVLMKTQTSQQSQNKINTTSSHRKAVTSKLINPGKLLTLSIK